MMTLHLRGVRTHSIIGAYPEEKVAPQELIWDLDLTLVAVPLDDRLQNTVDYAALCSWLQTTVAQLPCELLETLLLNVARAMRREMTWKHLRLTVHKPQALPHLQDVSMTLECRDGEP
ncbi:MAG: dihydroneopterin aldolase [Chlamydiia bacterium]